VVRRKWPGLSLRSPLVMTMTMTMTMTMISDYIAWQLGRLRFFSGDIWRSSKKNHRYF
jgi:hypothetical protein